MVYRGCLVAYFWMWLPVWRENRQVLGLSPRESSPLTSGLSIVSFGFPAVSKVRESRRLGSGSLRASVTNNFKPVA